MATVREIQAAADAWWADQSDEIALAQSMNMAVTGKCRQWFTDRGRRDEDAIEPPVDAGFDCATTEYVGPKGVGYIVHLYFEVRGVTYQRDIDEGPEMRDAPWRVVDPA